MRGWMNGKKFCSRIKGGQNDVKMDQGSQKVKRQGACALYYTASYIQYKYKIIYS